jgi:LuxR family quorum-sensing system transcriptional regulator CciR
MTEPVAFSDMEQDGQISARPRIVQDFALLSRSLRDTGQLRGLLRDGVWALGFHYFLLQGAGGQVWLADLPQDWLPAEGPSSDAVLVTAAHSYAPFLWSDISRLIPLSPAQACFMDAVHAAGVGAAVTVPIHRTRDAEQGGSYSVFAGCCSFMMKTGVPLPLSSLAGAHYIGALAFDAAENLRQAQTDEAPRGPHLTPRQRDCVVLVAQGKSDWEIGQLLGISESTVHKHIEDAKRRFAVSTRIQLVVRSLFDARLSFVDVMSGEERPAERG